MSSFNHFAEYVGSWRGVNRLWLSQDEPANESESLVIVSASSESRSYRIEQKWAFQTDPQEGSMALTFDEETNAVTVRWNDSFHTEGKDMSFVGAVNEDGTLDVLGSYAAPTGPDWGWRITIAARANDKLEIVMFNIEPDGKEELAVQAAHSPV